MQHVHWWLFALSFFLGLGLTFTLLKTGRPAVESESPTTKIRVAEEPPTTKIRVPKEAPTTKIRVAKEPPTTKIPVAKETPTQKIPVTKEAPTTKIPVVKETPTTKIPTVPFAPYGPGSARAGAEGAGPAGWLVKGRSDTRLYYTPDDATYERTVAQVWFKDEESAIRAYFTPWRKSSRK
ncbi:channel accessory protein ArfC, sunset domain variant [Mycobacterium sp.]|uniref:channel accessory protein ArfC, sunset domain variant n=1 Tax=Mycobacterium sp. TaxID=1785 RepID=UPI003F98BFDE